MNLKQRKNELSEKLELAGISKEEQKVYLGGFCVFGLFPVYRRFIEGHIDLICEIKKYKSGIKKETFDLFCEDRNIPKLNYN